MHPSQEGPGTRVQNDRSWTLLWRLFWARVEKKLEMEEHPPAGGTNVFEEHLERHTVGIGKSICVL